MFLVRKCEWGHHQSMKRFNNVSILACLIAVLVFVSGTCFAFPYQMGDYKVDVTVRNSAMNLIPGIKVALYRYDKSTILVEAAAAGYQRKTYKLSIHENQFYYKTDMMLADPEKRITVVDHNNKVIESAYIRTEQYGFPADHYGITAYIPVKMWSEALAPKVEVFDSFWGMPLKQTCEISQVEEFYCVKLSLARKSLKWCGSDLMVTFRTSMPVNPDVIARQLDLLKKTSGNSQFPDGSEEALTCYMAETFSVDDLIATGNELPQSLDRLIDARQKFAELHRENL